MLGPSLRSMELLRDDPPPLRPGLSQKTVRTPPPPHLIQCRLSHDRPWFCVSVMSLLSSETSSHVKLRNDMSM